MNPEIISGLSARVADIPAIDPTCRITQVTLGEHADGSRRWHAIVDTTDDAGLDQTYRILTPAPDGAPAWAPREWVTEVRVGGSFDSPEWMRLDEDGDLEGVV